MYRQIIIQFFLWISFVSCIKDKDYEYEQVYNRNLASVVFEFSSESIPADGNSKSILVVKVLPSNTKDSLSVSKLNLSATISNGLFTNNNSQNLSILPTYKLDPLSQSRILTDTVMIQSSTQPDSVKLRFKYLGVEQERKIVFYKVLPEEIKLSVSSLAISPDFKTEDTITVQLSRKGGIPSTGANVDLNVYDSLYHQKLGLFRVSNNSSNSKGQCSFIFILGDEAINGINYTGKLNIVGATNTATGANLDTLSIFSRY